MPGYVRPLVVPARLTLGRRVRAERGRLRRWGHGGLCGIATFLILGSSPSTAGGPSSASSAIRTGGGWRHLGLGGRVSMDEGARAVLQSAHGLYWEPLSPSSTRKGCCRSVTWPATHSGRKAGWSAITSPIHRRSPVEALKWPETRSTTKIVRPNMMAFSFTLVII